jgi:hypothetical protein
LLSCGAKFLRCGEKFLSCGAKFLSQRGKSRSSWRVNRRRWWTGWWPGRRNNKTWSGTCGTCATKWTCARWSMQPF